MKRACATRRDSLNGHFKTDPPPSQHLIAETFVDMQQNRHTADYDNSAKWTRTDVHAKVNSVQAAFKSWKIIRKETVAQHYLVTLLQVARFPQRSHIASHKDAAHNVAFYYETGRGVRPHAAKAEFWYSRASDSHDVDP
jgi:TPR repeat protein